MITFVVHLDVPAENAAAFEELMTYVTTMSLEREPGVLHYAFAKSVDDAQTYVVVEVYRDQAACDAHRDADWVRESAPESLNLITGMPRIQRYVNPGAKTAPTSLSSLSSLSTVRQFSKALGEKDLEQACSLLHQDLVVHEAGGLPYSGEYHGPQGFRELLAKMNESLELTAGPITRDPLSDDTVVSRFRLTFTARTSGESVEMDLVELYKVHDGLIVELDVYYKDPSAVAALLARSGF